MAIPWSYNHVLLGNLTNGVKVVLTTVRGGFGDKLTMTVDPLEAIYSYFPGIKNPGLSTDIFEFENYPEHSNIIYITCGIDGTGAELGIISFGI